MDSPGSSSLGALTPAFTALASIMEATHPGEVALGEPVAEERFAVFSYSRHFTMLWGAVSTLGKKEEEDIIQGPSWLCDDPDQERTVVIVWDGLPASYETTINVADYVTPYDWSLALALQLRQRAKRPKGDQEAGALPLLRVLLLDLKSQEHPGSLGVQTAKVASDAFGWVRTFSPLEADALLNALQAPVQVPTLRHPDAFSSIEWLVDLWRSRLTRPGDRHSVGNLLAPLLLTEGLPESLRALAVRKISDGYPLRGALLTLASALGLTERREGTAVVSEGGLLADLDAEPDPFDRKKNLRFLLVDDQYALGFHHLLRYLLLGKASPITKGPEWRATAVRKDSAGKRLSTDELRCRADAGALFDVLEQAAAKGPLKDWRQPRHLDLGCDVLLLDLRLWTDKNGRTKFLNRLVSICGRLKIQPLRDDDPSFKRAIDAAIAFADNQEASELDALALLPLLLSHYDPSLPIVLFSSTHQRSVVEMLAHRPNILTGFAKPILGGYGEERAAASVLADLRRTLLEAVRLHEARGLWKRITAVSWSAEPPALIAWDKLYNAKGIVWRNYRRNPPEPFQHADSPAKPALSEEQLRIRLAEHYVRYVAQDRHWDFASVPWELLEGIFTPDPPDCASASDPGFSFLERKQNFLSRGIQLIRHKKAHGHAIAPANEQDRSRWRFATLLLFYCWVDFISGTTNTASDPEGIASLRRRIGDERIPAAPDHPRMLTAREDVEWLTFVVYTMLWAIDKSRYGQPGRERYNASTDTCRAAEALGRYVLPEATA